MVFVAWASEVHKPSVAPRLGQAGPAKPRDSASWASCKMAFRFVGVATIEIAGNEFEFMAL